jgi:hypothetical protein
MQSNRCAPGVIHLFAVTILSAILLGVGLESAGIASPFSDPVARIRTQDESNYVSSAIHLATEGGWLTPKLLGRYFLYKPPLLIWLAGFSVKLFGISLWAVRLPALMAAVLATVVLFWLTGSAKSAVVAWSAAILLLSNPLWHIFARLCYTDMLLAASITGGIASLYRDRTLSSRSSLWGFALCTAAGVMAKSLAGVLPALVLLLYYFLVPQNERPPLSRIGIVSAITLALIAPWHLYQAIVHSKWFWADYIQVQLFGYGLSPPAQISGDGPLWFYVRRLSLIDPLFLLLTILALPSLWFAARRQNGDPSARLLAAWLAVSVGALLAFRFRNLPYALCILAPFALTAATYGPFSSHHRRKFGLAILILAFTVKSVFPDKVWGLSFGHAQTFSAASALRSYANLGRSNDLILVDANDYFYASTLPLASVRYYFFDPARTIQKFSPHYWYLGIVVSLEDFEHLQTLRPTYAARLKAWGLDSVEPLATSIVSTSPDGVLRLIRACPEADFYLPADDLPMVQAVAGISHRTISLASGRALLLALRSSRQISPGPKWKLPPNW